MTTGAACGMPNVCRAPDDDDFDDVSFRPSADAPVGPRHVRFEDRLDTGFDGCGRDLSIYAPYCTPGSSSSARKPPIGALPSVRLPP
jgi:hypothetical protein